MIGAESSGATGDAVDGAGDMLGPQPIGIPVPQPGLLSASYWDACSRGELTYQQCVSCAAIPMKPASICPVCLGRDLVWKPSSGLGTLYSWTVVWRPQTPAFRVPYAPAIVKMDEGWWLMTSMIGCRVDSLAAGTNVAIEFHPVSETMNLPYAVPRRTAPNKTPTRSAP